MHLNQPKKSENLDFLMILILNYHCGSDVTPLFSIENGN